MGSGEREKGGMQFPNLMNFICQLSNRRSTDLENEVVELRKQLAEARNPSAFRSDPASLTNLEDWTLPSAGGPTLNSSDYGNVTQISGPGTAPIPPEPGSLSLNESPIQHTDPSADTHTPGLTTRPDLEELQPRPPTSSSFLGPKTLGSTSLSVNSIGDLYRRYFPAGSLQAG